MYLGKKISIVIPAKNESKNMDKILPEIPVFVDEILLVVSSKEDTTLNFLNNSSHKNKLIPLIQPKVGKGDAQKKV